MAMDPDGDKKAETDLVGRVMLLEQKFRSISGRINALEMRITDGAIDAYNGVPQAASDGGSTPGGALEFVPGDGGRYGASTDIVGIQRRIAALEKALEKPPKRSAMVITAGKFSFDVTGLVVSFLLIAGGILLATRNFEALENPLPILAAGAIVLTWVGYKALRR